eukprot:Amastigsp_a174428_585.p4 type:complete len:185 gc:universal Amastigsp_a174428_585:1980-1426(-)
MGHCTSSSSGSRPLHWCCDGDDCVAADHSDHCDVHPHFHRCGVPSRSLPASRRGASRLGAQNYIHRGLSSRIHQRSVAPVRRSESKLGLDARHAASFLHRLCARALHVAARDSVHAVLLRERGGREQRDPQASLHGMLLHLRRSVHLCSCVRAALRFCRDDTHSHACAHVPSCERELPRDVSVH